MSVFRIKFKPQDEVYFVDGNRLCKSKVRTVSSSLSHKDGEEATHYGVIYHSETKRGLTLPESQLFRSPDELFRQSFGFNKDNVEPDDDKFLEYDVDYRTLERVYFINNNSISEGLITNVTIELGDTSNVNNRIKILLTLKTEDGETSVPAESVRRQKQDLLEFLKQNIFDCTNL